MNKPSKKYLAEKLDKMCGVIVRARGKCQNENCKNPGKYALQWAHIVGRAYHQVRWDTDNAFCLCAGCHTYFTNRPLEWEVFVTKMIGEEKYQELKTRALAYGKIDYDALIEKLAPEYREALSVT